MTTALRTRTWRRGLAFLAGVGFAAVPTVGPYLAILAIASGRLQVQRADRWWWAAALLLGLPWIVRGHLLAGVGTTAQVLAVWLIFRTASELRRSWHDAALPVAVGFGLVVGYAAAIGIGLAQSSSWRLEPARSAIDLFAWSANPALFGHAMVLLAALLAVVVPSAALRVAALALGALAAIVSGAQEAVLAWLLVAVGFRFVGRRGTPGTAAAEWGLVALMLLVASGLGDAVGLGRTGFRLDLTTPVAGANLFRGTEVAGGEWWYPLGVRVTPTPVRVDGVERTGYAVEKAAPEPWSRLQQIVELQPGTTYVLAVAWRATDPLARPGLDGWARATDTPRDANLAATWREGTWAVASTPHVTVVAAAATDVGDGWRRGHVAFRVEGDRPLVWYVGAVPDRSGAIGAVTTFAEFQLLEGDAWVPYAPNAADVRLTDLRTTRLPIWRDALEAIAHRPWLGWGPGGYPTAVARLHPEDGRHRSVAAHAHALLLDTWVERGVVGLLGLLLLAGVLALRVLQQRDRAMAIVLAAVALLNLFETTLLNGALIYPLAAVLGWRAVGSRTIAVAQTGVGSAAAVRLALAAADVAVAAVAISVGLVLAHPGPAVEALLAGWTAPLAYATLLWPAFAWASGLHPGYGRAGHDELMRGVRAAGAAAVTLGFAATTLGDALPLSAVAVVTIGVVGTLLAPLARQATKQALRQTRLWGRPIAVLGTGTIAERVARYLLDHPGVGLHPVAAFGDEPWELAKLPVSGRLDDAWAFLPGSGVRHVLVAPEAAVRVGYDEVLRRAERELRYVQFVPDLHGVPASSVVAAPLGTQLGLEVRNQLASGVNRAVKRTFDLVVSSVLLVAFAPLLLAIAAWVRLDSRGPAFYLAPRVGRYGRPFACVKFRSMHVDAEARLARLLASDPALRDEYERWHKLADDPRVTRAGERLRRWSLDELAQLVNVFLGHMSLVGPRPYLVRELDQMGPERDLIVLARPGITGYWQVEGRNDVTFEERQAMEASYVRNWSFWWDLEILLRTPLALLARRGK